VPMSAVSRPIVLSQSANVFTGTSPLASHQNSRTIPRPTRKTDTIDSCPGPLGASVSSGITSVAFLTALSPRWAHSGQS